MSPLSSYPKPEERRVLIVDDVETDRDIIRRSLLMVGDFRFHCHEAATIREATELIHRIEQEGGSLDAIFLDLDLPDDDGFALLKLLADEQGFLRYPTVVLTGSSSRNLSRDALSMGAQDYLTKGMINPELLLRTMENARERHRLNGRLRDSQRAADRANRAKSTFLANMSHEVRTPMTAIIGLTDLLLEQEIVPDRVEQLNMIKSNGEYLVELLNDILDISKIEAGKLEVERILRSPHRILRDVFNIVRMRAQDKGLDFGVSFKSDIPKRVRTDPTRLRQILLNLVNNAVKFTETGSVTVEVDYQQREKHDFLAFHVHDTGIGIREDYLPTLFEPFTQGESSTARKFGGSGLGLAISARLATLLRGKLNVKSKHGVGSTFTLLLKLREEDRSEERHRPTSLRPGKDSEYEITAYSPPIQLNCRILVAEDTTANQFLIRKMLEAVGGTVELVNDGQALLDRVYQQDAPVADVIVMDMHMPVLDGYMATMHLRQAGVRTPVIALTADAMEGTRERCLKVGCSDYVTKPIDREALIEAISTQLSSSR